MPETSYRHATNLRVPFERADLGLLAVLSDYKIGRPVPVNPENVDTAYTEDQLRGQGVVGLYTTEQALGDPLVKMLTGWASPAKVLGQEWIP